MVGLRLGEPADVRAWVIADLHAMDSDPQRFEKRIPCRRWWRIAALVIQATARSWGRR